MQPHMHIQRSASTLRRGGAVIIVVLALLSLMIFLGVFFFEFAQEEQLAAQNYANNQFSEIVNPEDPFAESDRQLIFGADTSHTLSPFYSGDGFAYAAPSGLPPYGSSGSHISLLAHTIGRNGVAGNVATPTDLLPHNGPGISTSFVDVNSNGYCDPADYVRFDMDGDGNPDAVLDPTTDPLASGPGGLPGFAINYSRAAQINPATDAFNQATSGPYGALRPFRPDVDYTYPDINNIFLAYEAVVGGRRIFIPSFHRPDLLMSYRQSGFDDVYTDVETRRLVMRPHAEHRYPDGTRRFITQGIQALSGDRGRFLGPFPFQVDTDQDGRANEQGYYSADPSTGLSENYELDVDVNGDGEPDGVWLDIGMDMITLSDGRQYVPLVSYLVLDADSLINLNVHGNLDGLRLNGETFTTGPFSVSNTGASPSEVNPLRVLPGDPASIQNRTDLALAQSQMAWNFGFAPNTVQRTAVGDIPSNNSLLPMANMEWYFLTAGREKARRITQFGGPPTWARANALEGRYGDSGLIYQANIGVVGSMPGPGVPYQSGSPLEDDDEDNNPNGQRRYAGGQHISTYTHRDPRSGSTTAVDIPYATHPIAPRGTGRDIHRPLTDPQYGQRRVVAAVAGSPVVWPEYPSGWEAPNAPATATPAVVEAGYPFGQPVFPTGVNSGFDDDDETDLSGAADDSLFDVSENLRLHAATADYARLNETSRLDELAPFNFLYARSAEKNRRNWTTHSFDFSELTYIPRVSYDTSTSSFTRPEVSNWSTGLGVAFPPDFGGTMLTDTDPFRPEMRMLLASEDSNYYLGAGFPRRRTTTVNLLNPGPTDVQIWRQPLNLNRLLVGYASSGKPIFRHLTPHPDMVAAGVTGAITIPPMIHDHSDPVPVALSAIAGNDATSVAAMEWWARFDRQRMARDIYTLLFLVGAPQDITPGGALQTPLNATYPPEVTREMAQFAVNYVDALDRDDVITRFEYDDNLSDGWNTPNKHVFGVERASITFSEVQLVQVDTDSERTSTLHQEDSADRFQYLHMELRNVSPFTVELNEGWRLSRVARGTGTRDLSVQFSGTNPSSPVAPGANFLIATHDGNVTNGAGAAICSDLYADHTGGSDLESILPFSNATVTDNSANPAPQADLDLCHGTHATYFTSQGGDAGSTFTGTKLVEQPSAIGNVVFDLVLERRQNPYGITDLSGGSDARGEWIEVDRFVVDSSRMSTNNGRLVLGSDDQAGVIAAFEILNSVERRQAFDPIQIQHAASAGSGVVSNHTMAKVAGATSNAANSVLGATQFTLWQPHFDRDLTSKYELLSIPLYGNWPLSETRTSTTNTGATAVNTFYKEIQGGTQFNLAPGGNQTTPGTLCGDFTAGVRFKFPNGIPGKPYQGWNPYNYQNCWYRLFDFVTVPRRTDQRNEELADGTTGAAAPMFRIPGKINLNTIRQDTILAALMDDEIHLAYGQGTTDQIFATDNSAVASQSRDFYRELLQSRDGEDYFAATAGLPGLPLPNSLVSQPFRGSSDYRSTNWSSSLYDGGIENGLLRSAPRRDQDDLTPNAQLGWRPAGTAYTTPTLVAPADFTSGLWTSRPNDTSARTWQALFDAGDREDQQLDHHTRDRILAKIANNSTTKSHVYLVWTAVGYFEAHNVVTAGNPDGVPQIGARMTDLPIHRKFMVVDMSQVGTHYDAPTGQFLDYRRFIMPGSEKRLR